MRDRLIRLGLLPEQFKGQRRHLAMLHIAAQIKNEGDAHYVLSLLRGRFGWTTCVWDRPDVEERLERKLTDEEWSDVASSREWESVSDVAYDAGNEAIWDLIIGPLNLDEEASG